MTTDSGTDEDRQPDSATAGDDTDTGERPERRSGSFYVKHAADGSVTLQEVETAQIVTLTENPGFEKHDIVEASLVAQQPMELSYRVEELRDRYTIPVETSPEPPTRQVRACAREIAETEAATIERAGEGQIHVLRVPPAEVDRTADQLHDDEMTYKTAARHGVSRVEIRTDASGIVSVRYLP